MEFSDFLRNRRNNLGLSQQELADEISLNGYSTSKARVGHWETGRNRPPLELDEFRVALALALNMDIAELLDELGYEVSEHRYSSDARLAADIVDVLPNNARRLAIAYLKLLKNEFGTAG
jgi:transcriptional regulator with XRE-family HTH domain